MNAKKNPFLQANPKADKLYSQYWWIISLNTSHRDNNPNVTVMHGYSKFQGRDEMKDKKLLMLKKILMLATRGYFSRSKKIEMFSRSGEIVNKSRDKLVVTLYPKFYVLENEYLKPQYNELQLFLKKLYGELAEGKPVDKLLPNRKPQFSKDDYYKVEKLNFSDKGQLNKYCERLINNGHSFDAVTNFQRNYLEKKPFTNP